MAMERALALELVLGWALELAPAHLGTESLARGDSAQHAARQPAEELGHIAMVPVRHMLVLQPVRHMLALALLPLDTLFDTQLLALLELHRTVPRTVLKPRR